MKPAVVQKIKQLRSEALDLVQKSDYRRAIVKFTQLEALDPNEPDWPRRAADCHRLLGTRAEQLAALGRAAEGYVRAGMMVKAMAIGKVMLNIDPSRAASLEWMNKLELPLGMSTAVAKPPVPAASKPEPPRETAPVVSKPEPARAAVPIVSKPEPARELAQSTGAANQAQKLASERGLIGVARAALRNAFGDRRAPVANAPAAPAAAPTPAAPVAPPPPAAAPTASPVAAAPPGVIAPAPAVAPPGVTAPAPAAASPQPLAAEAVAAPASPPVISQLPEPVLVGPSFSSSPPSSGGWQMLDDADLIESETEIIEPEAEFAESETEIIEPAFDFVEPEADIVESLRPPPEPTVKSVSLPPLAASEVNLHELVPGSRAMPGRGTPSGMFRLAIDVEALEVEPSEEEPVAPEDRARQQAREVLPAVPVFSEIDPPTLAGLIEQSRLIHVAPGETIYRQDDAPECFYVIVNGSVAVIDEAADGKELYQLKENEFFGEGALLSNEPRATSVRAIEECDLMAFDREAMRGAIASNPGVVAVLLRFLRSRMIEHLFQTSPLFTTFDTADRRSLTRRFEFIELSEGARLIEQGGRAPGLFILLSGAIDVTRREGDQEIWLATLERGGVVGEMSLLKRTPAVADVTSATAGFALLLPADQFRDVIMTHPPFLEVITLLSEERERANAAQLRRA